MKTYEEINGYRCELLEDGDFDVYHFSRTLCFLNKMPPYESKLIPQMQADIRRLGSEQYWTEQRRKYPKGFELASFVMYDDLAGPGIIVGIVDVYKLPEHTKPAIGTLHVLTHYHNRGLHLADILMSAATKFAAENPANAELGYWMDVHNEPSRAAAERNGFVFKVVDTDHEEPMHYYELDLEAYRLVYGLKKKASVNDNAQVPPDILDLTPRAG
jgi:RimJ/RimL family protein N-acetyltransferase